MTVAEKALSTFREPPFMYNCAQTICAAFGREDLLDAMKSCGGGKAPDGICGALYAAMTLAEDKAADVCNAFREIHGACTCRDLKGGQPRVACQDCVKTAASLLEKSLQ
ncbi:MAG: hypothetical protein E7031_03705 [Akkermansiaceae bacterium]|nr:hypothetical protein [Akkermansiaceae bacterium]